MEAAAAAPLSSSSVPSAPKFEPDTEAIKRRLLKKGVYPTPKIIHTLRKKEIQKHNRKLSKLSQTQQTPPLTPSQKQALLEESRFQTLKREYRDFTKAVTSQRGNDSGGNGLLVGKPWERIEKVNLKEIASGYKEFSWGKLKRESLRDLKEIFEGNLRWVLEEDDVEVDEDWFRAENQEKREPARRKQSEGEAIRYLVGRLSNREVTLRDWKLAKVMKQSGLRFNEGQLLKIVEGLGDRGKWEQAMVVVEWVYNDKDRRDCKSRYVYTKLLSVLGKARRPGEALGIFNLMREDCNIYPDMAAYHTIAVTLGQTGLLKELMKIIEYMREKPSKICKNFRHRSWDPVLEPDIVIYNAVLNACVPAKQWKGVSWVFEQLRKSGLRPNGATYGLAMEVMLHSGKYDLVHELFRKMNRSGEAPKALTYKVLVKAFWEEGKVNEAVEAVRDMEQRGVVGKANVYYELACCLCRYGRWQDAMLEVKKIKRIRDSKPLEVTFTGMILSSLDGGYVDDCISIFKHMKAYCVPNIGTINIMLKVFGQSDLFSEAKQLFEEIKGCNGDGASCIPDKHTYSSMLEASASALQWEYFEYVYKEMVFSGYQIDQSKHALLLVRASRAGKTHILEHAFDLTLEAGEVPHPLFFTELVFQAAMQENYERAISLVNAIGHAPFQISERQWRNVFARNRDKLSQDCLEKLLDALFNCDVASEVSVSNLSKSLHSLCGSGTSNHLPVSVTSPVEDTVYPSFDINNNRVDLPNFSLSRMEGKTELDGESLVGKPYDKSNVDTCSSNADGEDMDAERSLQNAAGRLHRTSNMSLEAEVSTDGIASHASVDDPENKLSDFILDRPWVDDGEAEFQIPVSQVDDSQESELPSAYEILDAWKESRREDGIFFPYQLGLK